MRILALKPGGPAGQWITEDSIEALRELGHIVNVLYLMETDVDTIISKIAELKVDFIFSIDFIGLSPRLLRGVDIPCSTWFIDDPFDLYLDPVKNLEKKFLTPCILFCHDRSYMAPLKKFGFRHIYYLPVAANTRVFRYLDLEEEDFERFACNLSFVGTSGYKTYELYKTYTEEKAKDPRVKAVLEETFRLRAENPLLDISTILEGVQQAYGTYISFKDQEDLKLAQLTIEYGAMAVYRREALKTVADLGLDVYGDERWKELLGDNGHYRGPIDHKRDLAKLYNASKINLNITRSAAKTSYPMRVFEISASRAFMLTDYRHSLGELFKIGEEVVCYRSLDELRRLAEYYLDHEQERLEIAKRAEERILRDHTYHRRMEDLIEAVNKVFSRS